MTAPRRAFLRLCGITAGFNFANFLYYVQVTVSRTSANVSPQAFTLRIF
jgi:hypothetical protein